MADQKRTGLIWDSPLRAFHWLLVANTTICFLTGDDDHWALAHITAGYSILVLLVFRLIWGICGTPYARFNNFIKGPRLVALYLQSLALGRPIHFDGHNPAGAIGIIGLLTLGFVVTVSGILMYEDAPLKGIESLHEIASDGLLYLIGFHILAVITSSLLHRENLIAAMLDGKKEISQGHAIKRSYGWVAFFLFITILALWCWMFKDKLLRLF